MAEHHRTSAVASCPRHKGYAEAFLMKRGLLVLVLAALLVLAVATSALGTTAPYDGVALYSDDATLTDESKVESPVIAGQPSAATYVNGTLKTSRSASLSTTTVLVKTRGDSVPPLNQFMPESLVSWLTLTSQAAQPTGVSYPSLNYSKVKGATFTMPVTVDGNLTISGTGTYSFDSVYVTGDVTISGSPTFSFASLRVGGKLTVSGGTARYWGPTYVAGDVRFSKSGSRPITLLVTAGNFSLSGTQTVGGDGIDSDPQPAQVLLVGQNKQATITDTSVFYGLLYNGSGGLTQARTSTIRGCVLLAGDYSAADTCSVRYDANLLEKLIHAAPLFTVSFVSNGGSEIEPMQVSGGQELGAVPVPNKGGSIFLGWYTDNNSFEQAVTKDTPVISDLTLYARYAVIGALDEADQVKSVSAMDVEPSFAIQIASSNTSMSAEDVKTKLQLEVVDGTPFAGLAVTGEAGAYVVTAAEGYTRGSSYKLTLADPALTFEGEPDSARTYCFTISKPPVANLELAPLVLQIPAIDISNLIINGIQVGSLSLPLASTEDGLSEGGDSGTFTYSGSQVLAVGDVLAIYEGTPPDQRDATGDYSDQPVAYVEVTALDGDTVSYRAADATDVLFTPDVLPVKAADDLDADLTNASMTIPVSKMTYSGAEYAEMGLNAATVVEEGDFLAIQTGTSADDAAVSFAKIISVVVSGSNYTIEYAAVTEDELIAAMDLYSSHEADYDQMEIDVPATEEAIAQQVIESGFAQAAAEYLTELAVKTDGFKEQLDAQALLTPSEVQAASVISNLQVQASINTTLEHFPGITNGLDCAVTVSFDVAIGEDLNLHLSGTFEEELRVTLNTSGGAVWRTRRVWFIPIPYIADYRMTGNVDLYTYTGIDVNATLTSGGGGGGPIDIAQEIQEMMGAQNFQPEEISAGCQEFYELYADMLANEHDYVTLFEQQIARMETPIDPFHILVGGLTLEFVVNADVDVSLGAQFDYTKGTRYTFTLLLRAKTATSSQVDLVDETYNFQFYVMGTLGLRAGLVARVELGLFSLSLDSIGLELEVGPYVRLWGYFFYELHYANHARTSNTSGALYLELGIYLETRFLAQALNGQYSYNPTLYEHEWPLWSAGSRYNIYDFSYALTDATDDIRMKGATRTYALPASAFSMKQLDLTEGDTSNTAHAFSEFTITFTNSSFSQSNGVIAVNPPAGQHITEGYMTVSWNGAPLSFTTVPISRTYHLVWDDLASSYMISFNSQGGSSLSPIVGAYGSAVTLPTPTRAGYSFGGWYLTSACTGTAYTTTSMPAENKQLYAKWTANTNTPYTVRHNQQTVAGTSYALFATQNLTGTTGSSVTPARNSYPGFTAPAGQTVTIAGDGSTVVQYNYTRNNYQLTFRPGSPDPDIVTTVAYGGQLSPPAVARAGYTFGGWYVTADCSGTAYTGTTMPASNLLLYAKWTANANTPYAVRHYQERVASGVYDLVATQNLTGTTGGSVTPALNSYTGFTAPATQTVTINGNGSTLVAYYYDRNSYDVIFHPNNGGSDTTGRYRYGALIVLPSVTKSGYTFGGWYDNTGFGGTAYTATSSMPAANLDLYASWAANTNTAYTVRHYQEPVTGTSWELVDTQTLTGTTDSQVTPATQSYVGFMTPLPQTVTLNGDGSTLVEYYYYRISYRATFHQNNSNPTIYNWATYGTQIEVPSVSWAGYTFVAWYDNSDLSGDAYVFGAMPARDLDFYAKWTANSDTPYTVRHYKLTVTGDPVLADTENLTGTTGTEVTPAVKAYVGFTAPASQTVTIGGDGGTVVEYYYYRTSYDVTFHPNNGESNTTGTVTYEASIETPAVSKEGYTLAGWYDNAEFTGTPYTTTSTMPAHDLDLYAKWTSSTVVLYQVNARSDLAQTDYIDWGQKHNPWSSYYARSFASPLLVKTANGHDVVVTNKSGLRFGVQGQGWSWGGPYGAFAYGDILLYSTTGSSPWTSLDPSNYDPVTLDFGTHPILAGGLQLEPLWHGLYSAKIEAFDATGSSLGSFTVSGDSRSDYVRHSNMEDYVFPYPGYGYSGSGSNTAAFLGVRSDLPIQRLVLTLLTCGPGPGGTTYQIGAFAINRVSLVSATAPAISQALSSGVDATVSAPAWVDDTITVTWDAASGLAPTGSIRVTGTMPDGHTWEVGTQPIPATATSPFTFTTTDQGLGTGEPWEQGVLGEGLYQFRAEYVPDATSPFLGAISGVEKVTVDAPEYGTGAPLPVSPVAGSLGTRDAADDFRDLYDVSLNEGDRLTFRLTHWSGAAAGDLWVSVQHNGINVDAGTWPSYSDADPSWKYSVPVGGAGVYTLLVQTKNGAGNYGFEYTVAAESPVGWYEGFDSYATDANIVGQGGWQDLGSVGDIPLTVSSTYFRSGANCLKLAAQPGALDNRIAVRPMPDITSGRWKVTAWWRVPEGGVNAYFRLNNEVLDEGLTCYDRGIRSPDGAPAAVARVGEDFMPISFVVDLDADTYEAYYCGDLLWQDAYTASGIDFTVASLSGGSATYLDDISIMPLPPIVN